MATPLEERMRTNILKWVSEARAHWSTHYANIGHYIKRYEAKRSISGLIGWGDNPRTQPKDEPWRNCSDLGIPIEAYTIEGLLPRFLKVCFGAKPNIWVRGVGFSDVEQAPIVQEGLNFLIIKIMKIYRKMKQVYKNMLIAGDAFVKEVFEDEIKEMQRIEYWLHDPYTKEALTDELGMPIIVKNDEPIEAHPQTGMMPIKIKHTFIDRKKIKSNPVLYSRDLRNIIIPKDAITADIEDWDWICDQYQRTIDWVRERVGEPADGDFDEKAVRQLEMLLGQKQDKTTYEKIDISEWHGKYNVGGDNDKPVEIVAFLAEKQRILLGWMYAPTAKRPFFHYQIIPREGSPYGIGIVEFFLGIRDMVDALFNQMIDRGSINNCPPVIVPPDHDPEENPFGPGAQWVSEFSTQYRVLELPKSEQMEFAKIEFLLAMAAKLFGATDFTPPPAMGAQRTATGIMTIVGEGNIKFDDMIRAIQDVNEDLYDFTVQLMAEFGDDEFWYLVTETENPLRKMRKQDWVGNFDFEAVGNSININREIEQNRATIAYRTVMESFGKNPVMTEKTIWDATTNFFRAIDMRNVTIATPEEAEQIKIRQMAQAIAMSEQQKQIEFTERQRKEAGKYGRTRS